MSVTINNSLSRLKLGNEKAREKRAKETGVTLNIKKRKKFVENHVDDCGDDISSIVKNIDSYRAIAINHDGLSESSDEDDYVLLSFVHGVGK